MRFKVLLWTLCALPYLLSANSIEPDRNDLIRSANAISPARLTWGNVVSAKCAPISDAYLTCDVTFSVDSKVIDMRKLKVKRVFASF